MSSPMISCMTSSNFECSICLDILVRPITLPCGHTYCECCVKSPQFHIGICPICRQKIPLYAHSFSVNIVLNDFLLEQNAGDKPYLQRVALAKQVKRCAWMEQVKMWLWEKAPWLIVMVLAYQLVKAKMDVVQVLRHSKDRAMKLANILKGENSLDYKFLLFSQFMRILLANIAVP